MGVLNRKCAQDPVAALMLRIAALLHKGVVEVPAIVVARLWLTNNLGCAVMINTALPGRGSHSSTSWESSL